MDADDLKGTSGCSSTTEKTNMSKTKKAKQAQQPVQKTERLTGYVPVVKYGVAIPAAKRGRSSRVLALLNQLPVTPDGAPPEEAASYEVPASQVTYWRTVAKRNGIKTTVRNKKHITGIDSDKEISLIWKPQS